MEKMCIDRRSRWHFLSFLATKQMDDKGLWIWSSASCTLHCTSCLRILFKCSSLLPLFILFFAAALLTKTFCCFMTVVHVISCLRWLMPLTPPPFHSIQDSFLAFHLQCHLCLLQSCTYPYSGEEGLRRPRQLSYSFLYRWLQREREQMMYSLVGHELQRLVPLMRRGLRGGSLCLSDTLPCKRTVQALHHRLDHTLQWDCRGRRFLRYNSWRDQEVLLEWQ